VLDAHFDGDDFRHWQQLAMVGEALGQGLARFPPDHPLTEALHAAILDLHAHLRIGSIPHPSAAAFQDWTIEPFGGAAHVWGRGVDASTVSPAMLRPIPGADLFVCGEAWSRQQGWVEGALASVDALLDRHFGLAAPAGGTPAAAR
jgi:hypothetical protein